MRAEIESCARCGGRVLRSAACGVRRGRQGADSPGNCPDGTILKGSDCVPAGGGSHASDDSSSTLERQQIRWPFVERLGIGPTPSEPAPSGGKTPYDKDSSRSSSSGVPPGEGELRLGDRRQRSGRRPLGQDDRERDARPQWPHQGRDRPRAVRRRARRVLRLNAFKKLQFPPYASSSDVVVQWDIEFVKPKH